MGSVVTATVLGAESYSVNALSSGTECWAWRSPPISVEVEGDAASSPFVKYWTCSAKRRACSRAKICSWASLGCWIRFEISSLNRRSLPKGEHLVKVRIDLAKAKIAYSSEKCHQTCTDRCERILCRARRMAYYHRISVLKSISTLDKKKRVVWVTHKLPFTTFETRLRGVVSISHKS